MRIFSWQGGLHIQPEGIEEAKMLYNLLKALDTLKFGDGISTHKLSDIFDGDDKEPVSSGSEIGQAQHKTST